MNNIESFTVYKFNHRVIRMNLDGITHEDSLKTPAEGGNSLNWILGHVILSRDEIFELLGLEKACDEKMFAKYERGTKDFGPADAIKLDKLIEMFDESQRKLEEKIKETDLKGDEEKSKNLAFYSFHEAYHAGQTGLLRRICGKEGAIK
jgi:uncharacterized damage-inducible protein DinB